MIHYPYLRTKKLNHGLTLAGDLLPNADGTYDLGSSSAEWQDIYIDGTANIDALVADTADINGGTIDGASIGSSTPLTYAAVSPQGAAVPTASSLAIQDNSTSGDCLYLRSTPGSSSSARMLVLHMDGGNWGNDGHALEIIAEDGSPVPFVINDGFGSDVFSVSHSGDISSLGDISLASGGSIVTTSNGNITFKPHGTGITIVGDAGSTSHSLAANDDLFVSGNEEVDGNLFVDGHFFPPTVTYATNMNTDVAGTVSEIVYCSTDSKAYVCTTTGAAGSAVWAALN